MVMSLVHVSLAYDDFAIRAVVRVLIAVGNHIRDEAIWWEAAAQYDCEYMLSAGSVRYDLSHHRLLARMACSLLRVFTEERRRDNIILDYNHWRHHWCSVWV